MGRRDRKKQNRKLHRKERYAGEAGCVRVGEEDGRKMGDIRKRERKI